MRVPVYLEEEVVARLVDRLAKNGVDIERFVNDLIKKHLEKDPEAD